MSAVTKTFEIKVLEQRKDGGRILISTGGQDRDNDRVKPRGGRFDNYVKNPVVQWGHNYRDPWATIGKTNVLEVGDNGVTADFTLRPAANESDPQNIVNLLWDGGWIRTASIGFMPKAANPNDLGGLDFDEWELLEWSLVPIPANQDALRLAVKSFDAALKMNTESAPGKVVSIKFSNNLVGKRGRVLSAKNEQRIRDAVVALQDVLAQLDAEPPDETLSAEDGFKQWMKDVVERAIARKYAKTAIPPHETPMAPDDTEWDSARVVGEANGEAQLRLIHAWVNQSGDPEAKSSYKLPHHLLNGEVVLRAVQAAGAALMGSRGGVDIPEDDLDGVKAHLAKHYAQFGAIPPWEQSESLPESAEDMKALEEILAQIKQLHSSVAEATTGGKK